MADFYQNGIVTTLHNLTNRHLSDIENDLVEFNKERPLGLLLPSLFSELEGEAMPNIVSHLKTVPYLSEIVIGLDRADLAQYKEALHFFSSLPQHHRILWNDGPRLKAIDQELQSHGLAPQEMGKGRNVWYCMGYILASGKADSIALHDCDIVTYTSELWGLEIGVLSELHRNYSSTRICQVDIAQTYDNGLTFDIHKEEKAVEMFAKNIIDAGQMFLESPLETPFIPSWNRVQSAIPDIFERLHNAVEEDHKEFSAGN